MNKVVDIAWVADKSLDLYCASVMKGDSEPPRRGRGRVALPFVSKIFSSVFDDMVARYSNLYDMTYVIVPCYPIMRMNRVSMLYRFICKNSDFLGDHGISSAQFMELFDKFISAKCRNEYITPISDRCMLCNGRGVLFHDWVDAIIDVHGSSLVELRKTQPFDCNPGFINTMEDDLSIFTKTMEEMKFKVRDALMRSTKGM